MADGDTKYSGVNGFIMKDPEHKQLDNGKSNRRILVSQADGRNAFVGVTVWDEQHSHIELRKGMVVAAQGKYSQREYEGKIYHNISASYLAVLGEDTATRTPVDSSAKPAESDPF